MLILARKAGESIVVGPKGEEITITVEKITAEGRAVISVTAKDGTTCVVTPAESDKGGQG